MNIKHINIWFLGVLMVMTVAGCAVREPGNVISKNDYIKVNYTCRTQRNEVIATTDQKVAENPEILKSNVLAKREKREPETIIAGQENQGQPAKDRLRFLAPEIRKQIAMQLVGKQIGKPYEMTLESAVPEGIKSSNRYMTFKLVRKVPRVQSVSRYAFFRGLKREPVVGEVLKRDGIAYARVLKISKDTVVYEMINEEKLVINTPWGKARVISEPGSKWIETRIDVQKGSLVRTGGVIGKVIEITETTFKVDYGHPFAEECLSCIVLPMEKKQLTRRAPKKKKDAQ